MALAAPAVTAGADRDGSQTDLVNELNAIQDRIHEGWTGGSGPHSWAFQASQWNLGDLILMVLLPGTGQGLFPGRVQFSTAEVYFIGIDFFRETGGLSGVSSFLEGQTCSRGWR